MLLDPSQVVGHISVDPRLVTVTTAGAPADDSSKGELTLCSSFLTYQRTSRVTLGREQAAHGSCPMVDRQGRKVQTKTPGLTWQASVPPSKKPAQSIPGKMAAPCTLELEQRSREMKGTCASCRKVAYSSAPTNQRVGDLSLRCGSGYQTIPHLPQLYSLTASLSDSEQPITSSWQGP